ncbi:uncharacterized protein [Haliotis cracherodii]|uniref:uncharacterized protein n=1 Tax=Haliotis cracherodii TaxID=6455 RepID=UPI0039E9A6E4
MTKRQLGVWRCSAHLAMWLIVCSVGTNAGGTCADLSNIPQLEASKRLIGSTFQTIQKSSPFGCARECLLRKRCGSFNFYLPTSDCDLNDNTTASPSYEQRSGYYYSEIYHWPTTLAGKCQGHNCDDETKCEVGVDMTTSCVTADITGSMCPQPDPIPNGRLMEYFPSGRNRSPGSIQWYACNVGFYQQGRLECLPDGSWSSATCESYLG